LSRRPAIFSYEAKRTSTEAGCDTDADADAKDAYGGSKMGSDTDESCCCEADRGDIKVRDA